jgi:hypothetical protein
MSRYRTADGSVFERKNFWMPCVIKADIDGKTPAERAAIYKATKWADLLTNAEWPVMLQKARNAPVRSRMKKKIVHWLMILGRIAALNPELFRQAALEAMALYEEQTGREHPLFAATPGGYVMMLASVKPPEGDVLEAWYKTPEDDG